MARKKRYQWDQEAEGEAVAAPSRSQKKRESTALQDLGAALTAVPVARLSRLPLTPELDEALRLMARITDREGRRRQLQYIGRLMRECDAEAVRAALEQMKQGQVQDNAAFHHVERLRTALLAADAAETTRLLAPWPQEAEELRELVAKARQETAAPHAARALFRRLRELTASSASADADAASTEGRE